VPLSIGFYLFLWFDWLWMDRFLILEDKGRRPAALLLSFVSQVAVLTALGLCMLFILKGKERPALFLECAVFWFAVYLVFVVLWGIPNPKKGEWQGFFTLLNLLVALVVLVFWLLDRWRPQPDLDFSAYMAFYFAVRILLGILGECFPELWRERVSNCQRQ